MRMRLPFWISHHSPVLACSTLVGQTWSGRAGGRASRFTVLAESMAVFTTAEPRSAMAALLALQFARWIGAPRFVCSRVALCVGAATASRAMRKLLVSAT